MKPNNAIQFKRQRDIGETINSTFKFLREEYKPLLGFLVKLVGPFFILMVAALGYYSFSGGNNPFLSITGDNSNFIISIFVLIAALLLFYASLYGTILHYIKSYVLNAGEVKEEEIKNGVQRDFMKFVLLFLITAVLLIAGFMLLLLPGIYLMVPLSLAGAILVFKNYSVTEAISYSFELIRDHWWNTFLTLIVMWILVYIISLVFQIPLIIYTIIKTFTVLQEGSAANPEAFSDWVFIFLSVFSSMIQYLLSSISIIAVAFIYFNLNEHKNLTGTYETIDNLGN